MTTLLLAYAGLFAWSFLAATVLPLSSEAPLAALVRSQGRIAAPVLVATAGNYLGACTTYYWLGRRAGALQCGGAVHVAAPLLVKGTTCISGVRYLNYVIYDTKCQG